MRFIFDDDIPSIILPDLKRYLLPFESLIPAWCARVFIGFQSADAVEGEAVAQAHVEYPYRWARITFHGRWTAQADDSKRNIVIHEMYHITLAPLSDWTFERLKELSAGNDPLKAALMREADERMESVTEDLALIFAHNLDRAADLADLLPRGKPNGEAFDDITLLGGANRALIRDGED